jgi:NAD(P)-dependent dehydrogenase (short-subunit alcohol dehydrogenase family)
MARAGSKVAVAGRDSRTAQTVCDEIISLGGEALPVHLDVTDHDSVAKCVAQVVDAFSRVDILVNNAGVFQQHLGLGVADDDFNHCLDVNLTGMWRMVQALVPQFKKQRYGKVVNISSTGGRRGVGFAPAYCASKAGVISLTQSLASMLGADRINVNAVCPGAIETALRQRIKELCTEVGSGSALDGAVYALADPLTATDIGYAVVFLASDYAGSITGQALNVDRGFHSN